MCACFGVRPPLRTLQLTQAQTIFSQVFRPPWLRGVMNLRGTIVPVVDVARFLGFTEELSRGAEALICGDDDAPLALLVDAVGTIRPATGAEIVPVPEHVEGMLARYLTGLYRAPDGLLGVLDFRQLLRALELGRATSDE